MRKLLISLTVLLIILPGQIYGANLNDPSELQSEIRQRILESGVLEDPTIETVNTPSFDKSVLKYRLLEEDEKPKNASATGAKKVEEEEPEYYNPDQNYEEADVIVRVNKIFPDCDIVQDGGDSPCEICCMGNPGSCQTQPLLCQTDPVQDFAKLVQIGYTMGGFILGIPLFLALLNCLVIKRNCANDRSIFECVLYLGCFVCNKANEKKRLLMKIPKEKEQVEKNKQIFEPQKSYALLDAHDSEFHEEEQEIIEEELEPAKLTPDGTPQEEETPQGEEEEEYSNGDEYSDEEEEEEESYDNRLDSD